MPGVIVGFLGLGIMGNAMAMNLIKSGKFDDVVVWNRNRDKSEALTSEGAKAAASPAEVVQKSTFTISMLGTPEAAEEVVFGENGVLGAIKPGQGYIDMSTVAPGTSQKIAEAITGKQGRFLEGPVGGSKKPAIAGELIILAAGDATLFEEAQEAFTIMGKKTYFLGEVGSGARMKLIINTIMGTMMGALCEGLALSERAQLKQEDLLDILSQGVTENPLFKLKGPTIIKNEFPPAFPLKHQQKDIRLTVALGDQLNQPMPIAAAVNETYKAAKAAGYGDEDFSAVYKALYSHA